MGNIRREEMNEVTHGQQEIRIEHRSELCLVGKCLKTSFKEGRQAKEIPPFFHDTVMNRDMDRVANRKNSDQYCIIKTTPGSDDFEYYIAVETDGSGDVPEGMVSISVPEQDYAVLTFIKRGNKDVMAAYQRITQDWLPGSGYRPAGGPGFILYRESFFSVYERYGYDGDPVAHAFFSVLEV